MMVRPCYLVVDPEHGGSISTRKLVLETAKLNVLTAYSGAEALATLRRYPALDGVVMDAVMRDIPCSEMVRLLKEIVPALPVVVVGTPMPWKCEGADAYLETFEPARLIEKLKEFQRAAIEGIAAHDAELLRKGQ